MTAKKPIKVLITAPSLDEKQNVSGISTVVRQIIEKSGAAFDYIHFEAGRRDGEAVGAAWIWKQFVSVADFQKKIRCADLAHINTTFNALAIVRDAVYAGAAKISGVPILLHVHGGRFLAEEFQSAALKKIAGRMLRSARAVVVLSELEKEILGKRWRGLNVKVLQNAVVIDEPAETRKTVGEKTLIFLGRLHESKGLDELTKAVRVLKNEGFEFRFRCYGAGEMKNSFVAEMTEILGDKFFYGGVVTGAEKQRALAEADVFLLPSRYGEGLPMALLEAMAAGCVVIAAEMASVGVVVNDGVNGFLIKPHNVAQLVEKMKTILTADETTLENLRRNARATVKAKFNLCDYIARLAEIYREIVS